MLSRTFLHLQNAWRKDTVSDRQLSKESITLTQISQYENKHSVCSDADIFVSHRSTKKGKAFL